MTQAKKLELLLLHALPLDGSMWSAQNQLLPGSTYAPTLYPFGDSIEAWAAAALNIAKGDRLVVVGCSVGGSCALEVAAIAPDRVAALASARPSTPCLSTTDAEGQRTRGSLENLLGASVFAFGRKPSHRPREANNASSVTAGRRARHNRLPYQTEPGTIPSDVSSSSHHRNRRGRCCSGIGREQSAS
jgi:pimeloyl-ACP methyl ester carboxylesterase